MNDTPIFSQVFQELLADVWDEAAEATSEWHASYHHGSNGPPDPPQNPYE